MRKASKKETGPYDYRVDVYGFGIILVKLASRVCSLDIENDENRKFDYSLELKDLVE